MPDIKRNLGGTLAAFCRRKKMGLEHVMKVIGDYWDERSSEFDMEHDTEDIQAWEAALTEFLGEDTNKSVADLGTGTGFLANMTARLGYPTVGIDLAREMMGYAVRHGKKCASSAMYMQGSALELPFMENSVDYIINARLIWTLVEPRRALEEWYRVIRPGGKVMCFNRMQEGVGLTVWKDELYHDTETNQSLEIQSAGMDQLKKLLEDSGFVQVEIRKLPGLTRPGFDYEPWFVLMGTKPVTKRQVEEEGMADFWDKSAAEYEVEHETGDKETWKKRLEELVGEKREIHILDAATGTGMIANMLGDMGYERILGVGAVPEGIFIKDRRNTMAKYILRRLGTVLIILFSIRLELLPVSGMNGASSIVLPAVTLSVGMTAATTRMMRSSMLDVLGLQIGHILGGGEP